MARALAAVAGEVPDKARVQRALLSVSDKEGVVELAQFLQKRSVEPLSTGGTAKAIRDAGVPVKDVSEYTGFPEMMDGDKTLHPKVHGDSACRGPTASSADRLTASSSNRRPLLPHAKAAFAAYWFR